MLDQRPRRTNFRLSCSVGLAALVFAGTALLGATDADSARDDAKPVNNTAPSWSPDGEKIAFYSDRDGNYEIYIMNVDGTSQKRLTHTPVRDYLPKWSPDGLKLVFFSGTKGQFQIHVMNADGTQRKALTNEPCNHEDPSFSPDGSQIFYNTDCDGDHELYVMNADGSDPKRLSRNTVRDYTAGVSPDGQRIAFVASLDNEFESPAIHIMNSAGSNRTQLTKTRTESGPAWSPDGTKIAFCSRRDGANDIYLICPDGTGEERLTSDPAHDCFVTWSPDASKIAFASKRDGSWQIYVMNADGANPTPLTTGAAQLVRAAGRARRVDTTTTAGFSPKFNPGTGQSRR